MHSDGRGADQLLLLDFSKIEHGHRAQYNAMIAALFDTRRVGLGWTSLTSRRPVLVPGIEASPLGYALLCLVRSVLGRRTAALLLRPLPVVQASSLRLRAKGVVLALLKRLPGNTILTIIPFAVEPGFSKIANDWIYDLQNWDRQLSDIGAAEPNSPAPAVQGLAMQIAAAADGRAVCCAVGRQDEGKGFHHFAEQYCRAPALRQAALFAYGGSVSPSLKAQARQLAEAGGFGLDRFISDDELIELYRAADLIWCVYGPDYDQASGILGRAMQLGLPVISRRGSVIARICEVEDHPQIAFDPLAEQLDLHEFPARMAPGRAHARARRHGQISLIKLSRALGIAPAADPFAAP